MTTSLHRLSHGLSVSLGLLPVAWVGGVVALAIRARLFLGYWPKPAHPDPKLLPFELHHAVLWCIFFGLLSSLIIVPALYLTNRFVFQTRFSRWSLSAYLSGWALVLLMVFTPNISFVGWFLD